MTSNSVADAMSFGGGDDGVLGKDPMDQFGRLEPKLLIWAVILLVLAAAALGFWHAMPSAGKPIGPDSLTTTAGVASPQQSIPDTKPKRDEAAKQSAAAAPAWPIWEFRLKEPIPPREEPLTPLPWRLIGASGTAGAWQLIVLRQGKTDPEYFRVGDKLPGGYLIKAITEEDVTLKHGRREIVLSYIASR